MYRPAHATSPNPEDDFITPGWPDQWTKTDDAANVGSFSAICLLFAKDLSQRLGNKVQMFYFSNRYQFEIGLTLFYHFTCKPKSTSIK